MFAGLNMLPPALPPRFIDADGVVNCGFFGSKES